MFIFMREHSDVIRERSDVIREHSDDTDSGDGFYSYSCSMICCDLREVDRKENK